MRRLEAYLGCMAMSFWLVGCVSSPETRKANNLWDMNYLARTGTVVEPAPVQAIRRTDPVEHRTGGVAIWTHPTQPSQSLVIGTDVSRKGSVLLYDLAGKELQKISGIRLPYGMAVSTGYKLGDQAIDIAVTAEGDASRLRIFGINPAERRLWEIEGDTRVLVGETGTDGRPLGVAVHRDSRGRTLALVSRKSNQDDAGIIFVYELRASEGRINAVLIRDLGEFSRRGLVENILVDDHYGTVFYYDQIQGVRKYEIAPETSDDLQEQGRFAADGWERFCTGMTMMPTVKPGFGYLLMVDRSGRRTGMRFFRREGAVDNPAVHEAMTKRASLVSALVNSIASTPQSMPKFPEGLVVVGSQATMTYDFYSWRDIRTQDGSGRYGR